MMVTSSFVHIYFEQPCGHQNL